MPIFDQYTPYSWILRNGVVEKPTKISFKKPKNPDLAFIESLLPEIKLVNYIETGVELTLLNKTYAYSATEIQNYLTKKEMGGQCYNITIEDAPEPQF